MATTPWKESKAFRFTGSVRSLHLNPNNHQQNKYICTYIYIYIYIYACRHVNNQNQKIYVYMPHDICRGFRRLLPYALTRGSLGALEGDADIAWSLSLSFFRSFFLSLGHRGNPFSLSLSLFRSLSLSLSLSLCAFCHLFCLSFFGAWGQPSLSVSLCLPLSTTEHNGEGFLRSSLLQQNH